MLQQQLAKYLVLQCFRNSMLEDLHAGISPSSASGDYTDVSVSSPYGVIPWRKVSRLNDDEMKRLMIDVVDRAYRFIHTLFDESTGGELLRCPAQRDPLPQWKNPELQAGDQSDPDGFVISRSPVRSRRVAPFQIYKYKQVNQDLRGRRREYSGSNVCQ